MSEEFLKLGINHPKEKQKKIIGYTVRAVIALALFVLFLNWLAFWFVVAHFVIKYW